MTRYLNLLIIAMILMVPLSVQAETSSGKITMAFDLSAQKADKDVQLWIPYPISNKNQTISNITVDGNYASSAVYTDRVFQNNMLYAKWDAGAAERTLTFTFDVKRDELQRRDFPQKEAEWDPADYALYLAPTRLGPIDGEVKKLVDTITKGKTGVLEKAKAIYDWTCENTWRNPETKGCGVGDVNRLLKEPSGKCADISSIYVALARAAGVPAREILGIRQGKKAVQDITKWQHCWSEFYLPGYGWVPVDPADVRKMMLKENLKPEDKKTKDYRAYFWGGVDPYRIKLGEGRDLELNPAQHGEPVNYLMYPYAQVDTKTLDWLDPATFKYTITYTR